MKAVVWALALFCVMLPGAVSALTLTYLDQERGVVSAALAAEASDFDERYDPAESSDFFSFDTSVNSVATTAAASAVAEAGLDSALGTLGMSAAGQALATATTTELGARGRSPADSFFELLFQVDEAGDVPFSGRVQAAFVGADGDAWASVELVDVDAGATLVSYQAAPGDDVTFDQSVALEANTPYRVTAQSQAYAQASQVVQSSTGSASYSIAVPEPSPQLQLVVGWWALLGMQRQRGRRARAGCRSMLPRKGRR